MTSTSYLDATFSSSVAILEGCTGDISNNFRLENATKGENIELMLLYNFWKGKIITNQDKVPHKEDNLNLIYTDNSE